MEIKIFFNQNEMKLFLEDNGYTIEKKKETYWNQWGNHDSQGEWVECEKTYVMKDDQIVGSFEDVFYSLMTKKIKNILLK